MKFDRKVMVQVDILKDPKMFIPKSFYSKGPLFRKVLTRRVIIPKILIPKSCYFEFRNNDPSR